MDTNALDELVKLALKLADLLRTAEEGWVYEYGLGVEDTYDIEAQYDIDCARIKSLQKKILGGA